MRRKGEKGSRAMHARYCAEVEDIPFLTFALVTEAFNKGAIQLLLDGHTITLPFRMGRMYVEKRKVNFQHLKLDYGHYRKTGEKLFHTNRHSDGYQAYFHWSKLTSNVLHRTLYKFIPARDVSRALAPLMREEGGHTRYVAFDPTLRA